MKIKLKFLTFPCESLGAEQRADGRYWVKTECGTFLIDDIEYVIADDGTHKSVQEILLDQIYGKMLQVKEETDTPLEIRR